MANIIKTDTWNWEVFFEGLPDWCIPLIKIIPRFYKSDDNNDSWDDLTFNYGFNYLWEKIGDNYKLYIYLDGGLRDAEWEPLNLYVDLSLWIVNTQYRDSIQHTQGY